MGCVLHVFLTAEAMTRTTGPQPSSLDVEAAFPFLCGCCSQTLSTATGLMGRFDRTSCGSMQHDELAAALARKRPNLVHKS